MPVVNGTIKNAAGVAKEGVLIRVELQPATTPGFVTSTDFEITEAAVTHTDASGNWSLNLVANSIITFPTGTYYKVTQGRRNTLISVPNGAGPYRVEDLLVVPSSFTEIPVQHMTPRIFTGSTAGDYAEISYGTPVAARDCKYRANADSVKARYMIRANTDSGAGAVMDAGTAGKYFALELPVPAGLTLGNGLAEIIGFARFGLFFLTHKSASVHTGRVNDSLNTDFCYFVADDTVAVANNSFGKTPNQWGDFHVWLEYDR